ncbi:EAL domain-containing protein [Clostridium sp. AM22-11AC]|jgi:EAL domain-containing protein (putative c-di-GMP-specific phosphodiesterase class I)/CheY-like chemotaxis protein|uniref:EAL domain-containing response regulator n=1 Tax=Clostridium sp. AM22-11AC TaxID=2293024 RepID=UPI000E5407F1|nr:EAL domain-containing response regulator [Clostridium sp. AM22-11AC]RHO04146.1 EAL domain-containing protein [Clostridium sp. AM22-11AC]
MKVKGKMQITDIINILGNEFSSIYCVNRQDQYIQIYRHQNADLDESMNEKQSYKTVIQKYIETNVFEEERKKMLVATDFDNICRQLQQVAQFTIHYRIKNNNDILRYRMKCARIGNADTFEKIVFAFASEDSDIRLDELGMMNLSNTGEKRKILIVENDEFNLKSLISLLADRYEIITACDGKIGLRLLEENYKDLALVLMNIQIPVLSGFDFLRKVQEDPFLSLIPIIVMTASDAPKTEVVCLNLGAADYIRKPYHAELIKKRLENVIRLRESSVSLREIEKDSLTGLYTEQAFFHYSRRIMQFRSDKKMHVIIGRIKDFELIISIYGRKKANELLCYMASIYNKKFKYGLLAKKGKASFLCLLSDDYKLDHQRMDNVINEFTENAPIKGIRIKYGIYKNIDKNLPITTICDYASMAAETVMEDYNHDYAYYTDELAQKRIYNQMIENCFTDALKNKEFMIYYQPKIDVITEKVIGAEALVRWQRTDGSMISPENFIPIYEKNGQIQKLDAYIFGQVCRLQKRILDESKKLLSVSVNLSRSSILCEEIVEQYTKIVRENDIPITCVPLEITESASVYGQKVVKVAERLLQSGFKLHIDDFGSGYSSMESLSRLPFSVLKIDKSLIDHICETRVEILVNHIIKLSKDLNMRVLAEGVETKEQLDILRKIKCDEIQGFYYARPMPEVEFVEYVRRKR